MIKGTSINTEPMDIKSLNFLTCFAALILKPAKNIIRKLNTSISHDHRGKILNNILID